MSADAYTKSLLHLDGNDGSSVYKDETGKVWTRANDAYLNIQQKKFGLTSLYLVNGGANINTPLHSDFDFSTNNFTIDLWIQLMSYTYTSYYSIVRIGGVDISLRNTGPGYWSFGLEIGLIYNVYRSSYTPVVDGLFHHIALVRNINNFTFYMDGVGQSLLTSSAAIRAGSEVYIGNPDDPYYDTNAYVDEFRVSNIARWTSNFTPPTSPYSSFIPRVIFSGEF